jgi:aryl sulfotransferase
MHIIQGGMEKSGNSWLYKIIQEIIVLSGLKNNSFIKDQEIYKEINKLNLSLLEQHNIDVLDITDQGCYFRVSSVYREKVKNLEDYVSSCTHVWTHSEFLTKSRPVFSKFSKIVYIIRDPRDVAISLSNFIFTPYMKEYYSKSAKIYSDPTDFLTANLESLILRWMSHVWGYLKYHEEFNIHFIFYERLLVDFEEELNLLLKYLDIELSPSDKEKILSVTSFKQMSKDNENHLRKGKLYDYVNLLSSSQKNSSLRLAFPFLDAFNYPVEDNIKEQETPENLLPYLRKNLDYDSLFKSLVFSKVKYYADPIYWPKHYHRLINKI